MNFDFVRHYWRGRLFTRLKRLNQALAAFEAALAISPNDLRVLRSLGYLHGERGAWQTAESYLRRALALAPDAVTWFNLGYLLDQSGRREQAIAAFREAVRLDSKLDRAWYGLGLAHAALGQHQEAVAALEKAGQLQPRNPHIWYALGMAQHHAHAPDKVEAVARHLLRFHPLVCGKLIQDTGRADLRHLVRELE
ncbi:tetratricopeptide repeat protein [Thiobacter aerophilum]|uniref:Tetratricopeptide repeat protein n=1 Tax=Thiobacter aerophilum TaxID=3121275 RepID=A0ABV0EJG6_9BURK